MSENTERLDAIQARMHAATPGPWRWDENYGDANDTGLALTNDAGAEIVGAYNTHCCSFRDDPTVEDNDAEFIAAAPSDVAYLLELARKQKAALDAVEDWMRSLDVIEELDPTTPTNRNCSAGGAASMIRAAMTKALEAKP